MVLCTAHFIFIEWGVVVFELRGAPFWSQTFRFAQTDGISKSGQGRGCYGDRYTVHKGLCVLVYCVMLQYLT